MVLKVDVLLSCLLVTGHIPKNNEQKKKIRSDAEKEIARLFEV